MLRSGISVGPVTDSLQDLLLPETRPRSPDVFQLRAAVDKYLKDTLHTDIQFATGNHEDATWFFRYLMDALREECVSDDDKTCVFDPVFKGVDKVERICTVCQKATVAYDGTGYLIPLKITEHCNLQDALNWHVNGNELIEKNCDSPCTGTTCMQNNTMYAHPKVLALQLNKTIQDSKITFDDYLNEQKWHLSKKKKKKKNKSLSFFKIRP